MKIAIDCRMMGSGGIGSFITELLPFFIKEHECILIGNHEECAPFIREQNVQFCFCDIPPFSFKESFFFPPEILSEINHAGCYFTPYCNIPGGIKVPVFSTIHDVVFLDVKELTSPIGRLVRKIFYQRAINYSDVIFTVSDFSKERILHHLHCKKEIDVVYNGAPAYMKEAFEDLPEKQNQILFVGNIKKHKGLKTLLDAFEKALKKDQEFKPKLVIVGNADNFRTGDEETVRRIQELSAATGLIEFTGKVSNQELKRIYAQSRFLVQPSLYEGFGMPPLEAMTLGTPALISDIPVFKEIYSSLPVTFFKAGDSDDLAEKLLAGIDSTCGPIDLQAVNELYSYERSAKIILASMSARLAGS